MLAALLAVSVAATAQENWLPPPVEDGAIDQLAGRLAAISRPRDPRGLTEGARKLVLAVRGQLDAWTLAGTLKRAPAFPRLELPAAPERYLDAMGRYQICNVVLLRQFESGADDDSRRVGALGLTAITLAMLHLRQPYMANGGSNEGLEAFLTSAPMAGLLEKMQGTPALLSHVETECEPVVQDLLSAAF